VISGLTSARAQSDPDFVAAMLAAITEETDDAIFGQDASGVITSWNRGAERIFGYRAAEVIGCPGALLVPENLQREERTAFERVLAGRPVEHRHSRLQRKDGITVSVALAIVPLFDRNEWPMGLLTIARDLTEEEVAQSTLADAEERLREGEALSHVGSWTSDIASGQVQWSEELHRIHGVALMDFEGTASFCLGIMHPEDREPVQEAMTSAAESRSQISFTYRVVLAGGTVRHLHCRAQPQVDASARVVGFRGISQDVTERIESERELRNASERLSQTIAEMEHRSAELATVREMSDMLQSCLNTEEAYGIIAAYGIDLFPGTSGVVYRPLNTLSTLEGVASWGAVDLHDNVVDAEDCWALRRSRLHRSSSSQKELECRHVRGRTHSLSLCLPLLAHGELLGLLHIEQRSAATASTDTAVRDNTERLAQSVAEHLSLSLANLKLREHLKSQSELDVLTGLYNRRYMDSCMTRELERSTSKGNGFSLLFIDIDHFKNLNDQKGHAHGDSCLRGIASLILHDTRGEDVVCRFGGDEFVMMLPNVGWEPALERAESIRRLVEANLGVTVSIGVASAPGDGATAPQLFQQADLNLYQAKSNGRNRVVGGSNFIESFESRLTTEATHE
jgi:diguanylate cyclase (GGDEF)-like protein/PAS domain S-box-containing protein